MVHAVITGGGLSVSWFGGVASVVLALEWPDASSGSLSGSESVSSEVVNGLTLSWGRCRQNSMRALAMVSLSAVANIEVNWWGPMREWHSNPGLNELSTNAYRICGICPAMI